MSETATRLMDLAETHIRESGYGGFSFRELAAQIGIKSASVHHHFPTKAVMVAAVARRYGERFFEKVAPKPDETPADAIDSYKAAFRDGFVEDGLMCLYGVLGTETGALTPEVSEEIVAFFRHSIDDLSRRIGGAESRERAFNVMATLEGGLMLARAYGDVTAFDHAVASLAQASGERS